MPLLALTSSSVRVAPFPCCDELVAGFPLGLVPVGTMGTLAGWKGVVPPSTLASVPAAFATATTASAAAAATNLALEEDLGKGVGRLSPDEMLALLPFSLDCSMICDLATNSLKAPGPMK